jgi:hypothetical protein
MATLPPPPYGGYSGGGGANLPPFPWDDRHRLGFVQALIETIKLLVTDPKGAFARLRPDNDLTGPLLFGLIVSWPVAIISVLWQVVFGSMANMMAPFGGAEAAGLQAGIGLVQVAIVAVIYPIGYLLSIFIFSGLLHLGLTVAKGMVNSSFGFNGTVKVVCYASVAQLAGVVPFLGGLIAMVGALILWVIGLSEVHRTTIGTAALAVGLVFALCCVCILIGFLVFGAGLAAMIAGAAGAGGG